MKRNLINPLALALLLLLIIAPIQVFAGVADEEMEPVIGKKTIEVERPPVIIYPSPVGTAVFREITDDEQYSSDYATRAIFLPAGDSRCIWPWLIHIKENYSDYIDYHKRIANMIERTKRTFSYSRLFYQYEEFEFYSKALLNLHNKLRWRESNKKPVLRFNYTDTVYLRDVDARLIWESLTEHLRGIPREKWNIEVAVRTCGACWDPYPIDALWIRHWSHAKLAVLDEVEVISSGIDGFTEDLGIHIIGPSAAHVEEFFDMAWATNCRNSTCYDGTEEEIFCKPKKDWEDLLPEPLPLTVPESWWRDVYVFSLGRGVFDEPWEEQWSADNAFFAALQAADSAFISQVSFRFPHWYGVYIALYPYGLLEGFAKAATRGTDLKLLINDYDGVKDTWLDITRTMEDEFNSKGLSEEEKDFARCRVRLATRSGSHENSGGHEKFYMMDHKCPVNNRIISIGYRSSHWKYCSLGA